uniref:Uncharacterized protein n=1 Tax=Fagus sylvatica TaxID=28930 RepID=A0A2N9H2C5_FAGSY
MSSVDLEKRCVKLGKRFTEKFSVNHFPKTRDALSLSLLSFSALFLSRPDPVSALSLCRPRSGLSSLSLPSQIRSQLSLSAVPDPVSALSLSVAPNLDPTRRDEVGPIVLFNRLRVLRSRLWTRRWRWRRSRSRSRSPGIVLRSRLWMAVGPREPRARARISDEGRSDEARRSLARRCAAR